MGDGLTFTIRYQRKIQTVPYENLTIGLEMEFLRHDTDEDLAFERVRQTVEKWIHESLNGERR